MIRSIKKKLLIIIGLSTLIVTVSIINGFLLINKNKAGSQLAEQKSDPEADLPKPQNSPVADETNDQPKVLADQTVMEWKVAFKTASPSPISQPITSSNDLYEKYGSQYNVKAETLREIAWCESQFRADSVNGPYAGLFQFSSGTWVTTRVAMGLDSNPDLRQNFEESIKTAAFKISQGGLSLWPNCSKGLSP